MGSTHEKRTARKLADTKQIPYTMALRLLREAKTQHPEMTWSDLISTVQSELE